jgi:hypothetical protein
MGVHRRRGHAVAEKEVKRETRLGVTDPPSKLSWSGGRHGVARSPTKVKNSLHKVANNFRQVVNDFCSGASERD